MGIWADGCWGWVNLGVVTGWVNRAALWAAVCSWVWGSVSWVAGGEVNRYAAAACICWIWWARASFTCWASSENRFAAIRVAGWLSLAVWRPIAVMSIGRSSALVGWGWVSIRVVSSIGIIDTVCSNFFLLMTAFHPLCCIDVFGNNIFLCVKSIIHRSSFREISQLLHAISSCRN